MKKIFLILICLVFSSFALADSKIKLGLEIFEVHKAADIYHRQACEKLLDDLSKEDQVRAEKSALSTAKYLWNFLTGMAVKHNVPMQVAA